MRQGINGDIKAMNIFKFPQSLLAIERGASLSYRRSKQLRAEFENVTIFITKNIKTLILKALKKTGFF